MLYFDPIRIKIGQTLSSWKLLVNASALQLCFYYYNNNDDNDDNSLDVAQSLC